MQLLYFLLDFDLFILVCLQSSEVMLSLYVRKKARLGIIKPELPPTPVSVLRDSQQSCVVFICDFFKTKFLIFCWMIFIVEFSQFEININLNLMTSLNVMPLVPDVPHPFKDKTCFNVVD